MYALLLAPFVDYEFMQRALIGCLVLSLSAAPVGVFLMLRRMSLMGDAMAHAILPGVAAGFFFAGLSVGAMTLGGLLAGCLVAVLSATIARLTQSSEDSSMAAFYLLSLSAGVLIISINGSAIDLLHVLFGSALALNNETLLLLGSAASITLLALTVLYRPLVMECFDHHFLATISRWGSVAHIVFLLLVVINLVAGFHALGTLMSVGIMVLPAAAARYWTNNLQTMLLVAVLFAALACVTGLIISFYVDWPSGPLIVFLLGVMYLLSILSGTQKGIIFRLIKLRHLEA